MDAFVSHFGDYRLDRAESFLHDRLVQVGPRGISVRGVGETAPVRSELVGFCEMGR